MHALWLHNSHDHFGDSRAQLYPASGPGKGRIYESNGMHHSCSRYILSACPMVSILFQSNLIQPKFQTPNDSNDSSIDMRSRAGPLEENPSRNFLDEVVQEDEMNRFAV